MSGPQNLTQTHLSLLLAKAGDGAASQGSPVPAAGYSPRSTSGVQLGLLHPGSSTIASLPLGLPASHPLGLTGLEARGLNTWGLGLGLSPACLRESQFN